MWKIVACIATCFVLASVFRDDRRGAPVVAPTPTPVATDVAPVVKLAEHGAPADQQRRALTDYLRGRGLSAVTTSTILAHTSDGIALRQSTGQARTGLGGRRGVLPPGEPWPRRRGVPLTLVATIEFAELPRLAPLPPDGTLALYYLLDDYDPDDAAPVRAYYLPPGAPVARPRAPRGLYTDVFVPWRGTLQPISGNPDTVMATVAERRDADRVLKAMNDLASAGLYPHHLLGEPIELQAGVLAAYRKIDPDVILLAQIQSDRNLTIADGGDLLFLIRRSDLEARRFDRVRAVMESH